MEISKSAVANNNAQSIVEQANIKSIIVFDRRSIEIVNNDCIVNILSHLDKIEDLVNCKRINKRFFYLIYDNKLLDNLLDKIFKKYCLNHPYCLLLPEKYLLYVNAQLAIQPKIIASKSNYCNLTEENISLKKKLLFSLEKKLAEAKELSLKTIITVKHNDHITSLAFSKDSNFFATAGSNIAKIYQFINGSWRQRYELNHININEIIFSPNNQYVITSANFNHIIWYLSAEVCEQITIENNLYGSDIFFRKDSKRLFIKAQSKPIKVYDLIENKATCLLSINSSNLQDIFNVSLGAFIDKPNSPLPESIKSDNWLSFIIKRYAIFSMLDNPEKYRDKVLLTELKDILYGTRWRQLSWLEQPQLNAISYSDDMRLIYAHPFNRPGVILEYTNNQWQLKLKFDGADRHPCFSPDNKRIVTGYYYGEKHVYKNTVWNIEGNEAYEELVLTDTLMIKFNQDGKYIIATHLNSQVTMWYFLDGAWRIKSSTTHASIISNVFFSNYNWMIATLDNNSTVNILEAINASKLIDKPNDLPLNKKINSNEMANLIQVDNIYFSPNSNYFSLINNKIAQIWRMDTTNIQFIATIEHEENITNILYSPDNLHVVISSELYTNIWEKTTTKYSKKLTIKTKKKPYIALKNNGQKILIAEANTSIKVFSLLNNNWQQDLVIAKIIEAFEMKNEVFIPLIQQINEDYWLNFALQQYAIIERLQTEDDNTDFSFKRGLFEFTSFVNSTSLKAQIENIVYTKEHKAHSLFGLPNPSLISYSQDQQLIYLGFINTNCVIIENNNNRWHKKIIFNGSAGKAYFSPDNQRIITISSASENSLSRMVIWNIATDKAYQELGLNNISSANFTPDNKYIATASTTDNTVKIWSLIDEHWQVEDSIVNDITPSFVSFSHDSRFISIVYENKTVKFYALS